ncbi:hypothetical protein SAMD00019534_116390 [Acytostelium subglobosum LB1]|uniref:hypothetical protein n=1 Tax=Acytostelium subglobosum LB1 TaxID=1410327 RepID=UPI0006447CFC|nr:hypothetical protein SAMD00019534_116390 [Acytostelium subglobosum LB1]GAM28463.1 hypothetical protein SAMD00019534_116390 [Acytostelium subglobosum LB1]|eukprot:XP_012748502.1 hypothetical protein SAMD00019534_116390 [Acytostelium subglobosum LB1]
MSNHQFDNKENLIPLSHQLNQQHQQQQQFACFSNWSHIGDPIHDVPLPTYRNDCSVASYLQEPHVLTTTLEALCSSGSSNNSSTMTTSSQASSTVFHDINVLLQQTDVSFLKLQNDISNRVAFSPASPVLTSLTNHLPSLNATKMNIHPGFINANANNNTINNNNNNNNNHMVQQQPPQSPYHNARTAFAPLPTTPPTSVATAAIPSMRPHAPYVGNARITQQTVLSHAGDKMLTIPYDPSSTYVHSDNSYINSAFVDANGVPQAQAQTPQKKKTTTKTRERKTTTTKKKATASRDVPATSVTATTEVTMLQSQPSALDQHLENQLTTILAQQKQQQQQQHTPIERLDIQLQHIFDNVAQDKEHGEIDGAFIGNLRNDLAVLCQTSVMQLQDLISLERYANLFQNLLKFMKEANNVHSLSYREDSNDKEVQEFHKLELSFESAILILQILNIPIVGTSLAELIDDEIVEFASIIKSQYTENILGHLDPSFKSRQPITSIAKSSGNDDAKSKGKGKGKGVAKGKTAKSKDDESEEDDDEDDSEDSEDSEDDDEEDEDDEDASQDKPKSTKKKQKVSSKSAKASVRATKPKSKKNGHNYFQLLCNKVTEIFDGVAKFTLSSYQAQDPYPTIMVDCALPCFFITGINFIQLSAVELLRTLFYKYPQHRESIFEQVLSRIPKTIALKKSLRTYKLKDGRSIQNITALLLQFIQSSPQRPDLNSNNNSDEKKPMKMCHDYSSMIILYFIDKCSVKTDDCEYRTILENLVTDLLVLINHPEWPAANMFLHLLSVSLCRVLSDKVKFSDMLKMMVIDLMGVIISKLKHECMLSSEEVKLLPLPFGEFSTATALPPAPTSPQAGVAQTATTIINEESEELERKHASRMHTSSAKPVCQCGKYKIGSFTIKCGQCQHPHHDLCAPDYSLNDVRQQEWLCVRCRIINQIGAYEPPQQQPLQTSAKTASKKPLSKRKKGKASKKVEQEPMDEDEHELTPPHANNNNETTVTSVGDFNVLIQLLLNYLQSNCQQGGEAWLVTSKHFLITSWIDSEFVSSKLSVKSKQYILSQWEPEEGFSAANKCYTISPDMAIKAYRLLSVHIKASLFQIVNELLYNLLSVLFDPSKTARAKAMKSFSTIVEVDPSVLADEIVHASIKNRFSDDAISVREHTVDLIGKYILLKPELTWGYIDLIAERIADKGISVRKRVVKTLHDVCLAHIQHPKIPYICKILVGRISDEESIKELVVQTFKDLWFGDHDQTIEQKTKQIVEVVKQLNQDDWFVDLIHKLIDPGKQPANKRATKQQKSAESTFAICQSVCSHLVDMLISFDEKRRTKEFPEFLAIFKCLRIFCKIDPKLLVSYIKVLHPYIKLSGKTVGTEETKVYITIVYIIQKVIPLIENVDTTFLTALEKDLLYLISSQGSLLVRSCIKCLCTIVQSTSYNYRIIEEELCRNLMTLQFCGNKPKSEILRALYITGLYVRYFDFEKHDRFSVTVHDSLKFEELGVVMTTIPIISKLFTYTKDKDVISKSVESIGNIIISSPVILNKDSIRSVISQSLSSPESKIKETILRVYLKLLKKEGKSHRGNNSSKKDVTTSTSESEDMTTDNDESSEDTKAKADKKRAPIISMQIDIHGESLVSSIQKYFTTICKLLLDTDQTVRLCAISTVELIVQQGIINPLEAVPEIITLETDANPAIADIAHKTLVHINQKHSSTLFKRVVESLKLCFMFHMSIGTKSPYNNVSKGLCKFYMLFRHLKAQRTTFIQHIMSQFDSTRSYRHKDLEYYRFVVELLASLPYNNMDEIFEIIVSIDKIVSLEGSSILSDIQTALGKKRRDSVSETQLLGYFVSSQVVTLLVELKQFLIQTYDINKERATAFLENTAKNADKLQISLPDSITFTKTNYPFSTFPAEDDLKDEDTQKKLFVSFKSMMKSDNVDFSTISEAKKQTKKRKSTKK